MSNLTKRMDKLENEVMGGQPTTIIIRSFAGTQHFDSHKNPEKFERIKAGWPKNFTILVEKTNLGNSDE